MSGGGRIYEFTVMRDGRVAGFEESVPYICVAVELDEEPALLLAANLLDAQPTDVQIGRRVALDFEDIGGGFLLPQFRLV